MTPMADQFTGSAAEFSNPTENIRHIGVTNGMRVADLGAGSGAYTLALAALVGDGGRVYAVDVQKDLLARIKTRAGDEELDAVETVWGDIDRAGGSKLADEELDAAVLANTLFQLEDKKTALGEAHRILKPGGALAVIEWSDSHGGLGPQPRDVVPVSDAKQLCDAAEFEIERDFHAGAHHYGFLCRKPRRKRDEDE